MRKKFLYTESVEIVRDILIKYENGYGTCELAKEHDLNRWTVLEILKRNDITPERITRPYKNKYNIKFFSEYNEISAYWAGFIFADGNIHSKRKYLQIGLHKKDEGHLLKFSKAINFTGPIYTDISTDSRKIQISGKWFAADLLKNFNICSKKSLVIRFPNQVPEEFMPHFVRGIFDGDGCITRDSEKERYYGNFTGNIYMLEELLSAIQNGAKIYTKSSTALPAISISNKNDLVGQTSFFNNNAKLLFEWMYRDSNKLIRLDRKYEKYIEYFGKK